MSQGHGIIVNLSSYLPFVFTYNPSEVSTTKKINYFSAPNIGGSHHKEFFTGFDNKTTSFNLICIDNEGILGVTEEMAFFEALRQPDPGLLGLVGAFSGNENYPPPQVLFNFGTGSLVPLVWTVKNVGIKASQFHGGQVRGLLGVPRRADISISLSLDEDNILNKANQVALKAAQIAGSIESITRETIARVNGKRREKPGIIPPNIGEGY